MFRLGLLVMERQCHLSLTQSRCVPWPRVRRATGVSGDVLGGTDSSSLPDGSWVSCCVEHDIPYWCGGTRDERRAADARFRQCVADADHPWLAAWMEWGVRVGGHPWIPAGWRWGFGHPYPEGYGAPDPSGSGSDGRR